MLKYSFLDNDLTFKQVFSHEDILEDLITSFLEYIGKNANAIRVIKIIPHSYIGPNNKKYRGYYGDLTAIKDNQILSIEMYSNAFSNGDYNKSLGYLCRLYSNQKVSTEPNKYQKVISINFIKGNYKRINDNIVNA